jgi:hypothetical protein
MASLFAGMLTCAVSEPLVVAPADPRARKSIGRFYDAPSETRPLRAILLRSRHSL